MSEIPCRRTPPQDKDLWKTFANVEDRTFDLLVNTSHEISPDGQSRYHQAIVSIRQMSIKTVFVSCPDGMRVWGGGGERERDRRPGLVSKSPQ